MSIKIFKVGVRPQIVPMSYPVVPAPGQEWYAAFDAPGAVLSFDWNSWEVVFDAPAPEIAIEFGWSITFDAPSPEMAIILLNGGNWTADFAAPAPGIVIEITKDWAAVFEAPAPTMTISFGQYADWAFVLTAPGVEISTLWEVTGLTGTEQVWVVNVATGAHSVFTNFGCAGLFRLDGIWYGLFADGIYELTGDKDATTQIDAKVQWPASDLGVSRQKNASDVYVKARRKDAGTLKVVVTADEQTKRVYTTPLTGQAGMARHRRKLAKGISAEMWQFGVENVDGGDLHLSELLVDFDETAMVD